MNRSEYDPKMLNERAAKLIDVIYLVNFRLYQQANTQRHTLDGLLRKQTDPRTREIIMQHITQLTKSANDQVDLLNKYLFDSINNG